MVTKEAVVTGEVVINKERVSETQQVADTVRKEVVRVDESAAQAPAPARVGTAGTAGTAGARNAAPASASASRQEPRSQASQKMQPAEGMDVSSSDGTVLGVVKEIRASDFLLDRSGQRDLYVPLSAVAQVTGQQVVLNVAADDIGDQGWPNPSLF